MTHKIDEDTSRLLSNPAYKKVYGQIIKISETIRQQNKKLLVNGDTHEYQCNANVLKGLNKAIEKLPKP